MGTVAFVDVGIREKSLGLWLQAKHNKANLLFLHGRLIVLTREKCLQREDYRTVRGSAGIASPALRCGDLIPFLDNAVT